ncbi:hypothetical protein V9K67_24205 [Paraflavisolibacter sp. H34]|uniref:hypothetical protein n=1 Tax=Huijunlia imazamoxiresistens TaxID=3127457 RepID=UPI003017AFAD
MKHIPTRIYALIIGLCGLMASCKKEASNIFNMFDVTLTLHNDKPNAAAERNDLNPGDSVVVDYTINSPNQDMYMVCVLKVGATTPFIKIPINETAKRRSYSGQLTLKAEGVGESSYRIWALDKDGVFLGDGYKTIVLNVLSDYRHLSNRKLYFPDTVGKQAQSYLSLAKGTTYSYTEGAANAADIDLGIYRAFKVETNGTITTTYYLYSPSAPTNPFAPYDLSGWANKRTTLFSAATGSAANFISLLKSGKAIEAEAKKVTLNLTHVSAGIKAGQYVFFRTPEGKYGAMVVNAVATDYLGNPYLNVSIKIQN